MATLLDAKQAPLHSHAQVVGIRDGGRLPHREHNRSSMRFSFGANWRNRMTEWHKPEVTEQEVGLEVTSYLPAELDS